MFCYVPVLRTTEVNYTSDSLGTLSICFVIPGFLFCCFFFFYYFVLFIRLETKWRGLSTENYSDNMEDLQRHSTFLAFNGMIGNMQPFRWEIK